MASIESAPATIPPTTEETFNPGVRTPVARHRQLRIGELTQTSHRGMARLLAQIDAPSTLGSFLRAFTFGHIRQLDAVAARFLVTLAKLTGVFAASPDSDPGEAGGGYAWVDVDDTVVEVHGHAKQGAGFGYNRIRGLNALLATLTTTTATTGPGSTASGPVIVPQRLRKGARNSSRGAKRLVADATKTARRLLGRGHLILVRMDSALYGRGPRHRCSPLRRKGQSYRLITFTGNNPGNHLWLGARDHVPRQGRLGSRSG